MPLRVLVVDDSSFFRRRVSEILNKDPDLDVVDFATNGREAIEKAEAVKPDVITMDVEMPVMDGITAVKKIMEQNPTAILMFSSLTHKGAKATLDALEAGAIDFLPKKFEDIARDKEEASLTLRQRVKTVARSTAAFNRRPKTSPTSSLQSSLGSSSVSSSQSSSSNQRSPYASGRGSVNSTFSSSRSTSTFARRDTTRTTSEAAQRSAATTSPAPTTASSPTSRPRSSHTGDYKLLAIGTSTGGPVALQTILTALPGDFPTPILLIQHMPATFTAAFASRLDSLCQIRVKEAENGDVLEAGCAYLAPGGQQMLVEGTAPNLKLRVMEDNSPRITYKPSVDVTFGTTAKALRDKVLAVVLTGMGADGRDGARLLKNMGSTVWAQDEQSCVVYGMPQAVSVAGLADADIPLNEMSSRIVKEIY